MELDVAYAAAEPHAAPAVPETSRLVVLATRRAVADVTEAVVVVDADFEFAAVVVGEERLLRYLEAMLRVAGEAMKDLKRSLLPSRLPKRPQGFVIAGGADAAEYDLRAEWGAKDC